MFIYCFLCRRPGAEKEDIEEVQAPNEAMAIMILAHNWPGIHIIKPMGSYLPGMKGTA